MARTNQFIEIMGRTFNMHKSKYTINRSPVAVSDYMTGKMEGIPSISTACTVNPICIQRMQDGNSVCAACFAETTLARYKDCRANCESNFYLLTESVLDTELLPRFGNVRIARLESFGDVANVTQAINYLNIIRVNPLVIFAWWSKNMHIIQSAIDRVGKPKNVILVESAPLLNVEIEPSEECVDKTFTVYTPEYLAEHGYDESNFVNCGGRCCMTCQRCYSTETETKIREQLK